MISSFIIEVLINIFFLLFLEKIVEICSCFGYEYSQVTHGKCIGIFGLDIIIHGFVYEKVVFPLLRIFNQRENTQSVDLSCLQYYVTHATVICELPSCLGILYDGIPCVRTFHLNFVADKVSNFNVKATFSHCRPVFKIRCITRN